MSNPLKLVNPNQPKSQLVAHPRIGTSFVRLPKKEVNFCGNWQISEDHYRVTFEDLMEVHEEALKYGGESGIRDENALQSAINTPYVGYYPEIYEKAAAILRGIACNHGFIDGNKRSAILVAELFVRKSGFRLDATDDELKALTLSLVIHEVTREDVSDWFSTRIRTAR